MGTVRRSGPKKYDQYECIEIDVPVIVSPKEKFFLIDAAIHEARRISKMYSIPVAVRLIGPPSEIRGIVRDGIYRWTKKCDRCVDGRMQIDPMRSCDCPKCRSRGWVEEFVREG